MHMHMQSQAAGAGARSRMPRPAPGRRPDRRAGQALVIISLIMLLLILFVGLAVDAANLMGKRAKLQSAVDASALSAAQMLVGGSINQAAATTKVYQILETNGVLSPTLVVSDVTFPAPNQVHVHVVQRVDTFFMRVVPAWRTMQVSAEATADINAYAEINSKPYGRPGEVTELNLMVWGPNSHRTNGDAYSPRYDTGPGGGNPPVTNPDYSKQPYGYLFRIDVPPNYPSQHDQLLVEIFDADTYNRPDYPPTPCPAPGPPPGPGTPTPVPCTPTADMYAYCPSSNSNCTTGGARYDTGLRLNAYPNGKPAFWRVDEFRRPYNQSNGGQYSDSFATTTVYSIWHFNPRITSAFDDPRTLSDYPPPNGGQPVAVYTSTLNTDNTDLSWYHPPQFVINLKNPDGSDRFERETNGSIYFYLYVQGVAGSSENNYDLRVGPPELNGGGCAIPCYVNQLYFSNAPAWNDGGVKIFAKRALPLNLDTGTQFPVVLSQISKFAAGQVLGVRHFDMDCTGSGTCSFQMRYQMQKCGCTDLSNDNCWADLTDPNGNPAIGHPSDNDTWFYGSYPDTERVQIPFEGTTAYSTFFGNSGQCSTSWLRIYRYPSYSQDTTVWELPFLRPRLIR